MMINRHHSLRGQPRYQLAGRVLLVTAVLALVVPILATSAQPHAAWIFTTSYGAVAMVVGLTLIRVDQDPPVPVR